MKEFIKCFIVAIILAKITFITILSIFTYGLLILLFGRIYLESGETLVYKNLVSDEVKVYKQVEDGNFYDPLFIRKVWSIKNSEKEYRYSITFDTCDNYRVHVYFILRCKFDVDKIPTVKECVLNDDYIVQPIEYSESMSFIEARSNFLGRISQDELKQEIVKVIMETKIPYNYVSISDVEIVKIRIKKNQ